MLYLVLDEHGAEAIKQLERGDDVALNQQRCCYCSSRPPARTDGHLVEPLLEGKLADSSSLGPAEHVVHVHVDVAALYEGWRAVNGSSLSARPKVGFEAPNKETSAQGGAFIENDVLFTIVSKWPHHFCTRELCTARKCTNA